MDFEPAFDWATLFANAWEPVLGGEVSAPISPEDWAVFMDRGWDSIINDAHAVVEPRPLVLSDEETIDTRPTDTSKVVYDLSNVSWNEGAPNIDASYFDTISFANGEVSYVTTAAPGPLPYGGSIQLTLKLEGGPIVWSRHDGSMTSAGALPYIQRAGDNWSGDGEFNAYRVWATKAVELSGKKSGEFTVTVPLTDDYWGGVTSDITTQQFRALLANPVNIGFTLFNGIGAGKGEIDYTSSDGVATLNVVEYKVLAP
jgi:hypothetical protein